MKTIRLLYPDYLSGGLETYYFGANLLAHILPENENQPLLKVPVAPPDGKERQVTDGIYAKEEVTAGIRSAMEILEQEKPDKIITIGGNCIVSQASFDYLHGLYDNLGIIWIDAHPDVSQVKDEYPNAHAMVLGSLMGSGDPALSGLMKNRKFQAEEFVSEKEILEFTERFDHVLIHLDIDVLDPGLFHSTYFANGELVGDGSGGGRMTVEDLSGILKLITGKADVVGFTVAEYLPFDEHRLHKMFSSLELFTR